MLTWPLIALGWVVNLFQRGAASMARLLEMLDARPAIAMPPARRRAAAGDARTLDRVPGRRLPLSATPEDDAEPRWVLRDVSFTVPAGATLAVVGATGSGKSALIDLIPRVVRSAGGRDPASTACRCASSRWMSCAREIGYVPQESFLFSDTIAREPRVRRRDDARRRGRSGRARASPQLGRSDDRREFPAATAPCSASAGSISRAARSSAPRSRARSRDAGVVLLDDALSAVDTHTEAEILRGLRAALAAARRSSRRIA